jgi:hypothetical protein
MANLGLGPLGLRALFRTKLQKDFQLKIDFYTFKVFSKVGPEL